MELASQKIQILPDVNKGDLGLVSLGLVSRHYCTPSIKITLYTLGCCGSVLRFVETGNWETFRIVSSPSTPSVYTTNYNVCVCRK